MYGWRCGIPPARAEGKSEYWTKGNVIQGILIVQLIKFACNMKRAVTLSINIRRYWYMKEKIKKA